MFQRPPVLLNSARLMDVIAKLQKGWRFAVLVLFGAVACVFLFTFLATAGFILLFITLPIFLIFSAPAQLVLLLSDSISSKTPTALAETLPWIRNGSRSRRNGSRSIASNRDRSFSKGNVPNSTVTSNSSPLVTEPGTPRSLFDTFPEDVMANVAASEPAVPLLVEQDAIVESPMEPFSKTSPRPIEALSSELIEKIVKHLPQSSISTLALVSKRLGTQFRFRRVHSGTEDGSLSMFAHIKHEPRLGQHTTTLVVHPTFFRPPRKVQWLLEGSDLAVAAASLKATEARKQLLLLAVLRACPRIRSLTWNDGELPLSTGLTEAFQSLSPSLHHLDVPVGSPLISHINVHMPPGTLRLDSLTLRGGFPEGSSVAVMGLFFVSTTIRRIRFVNTDFGISPDDGRLVLTVCFQQVCCMVDVAERHGFQLEYRGARSSGLSSSTPQIWTQWTFLLCTRVMNSNLSLSAPHSPPRRMYIKIRLTTRLTGSSLNFP